PYPYCGSRPGVPASFAVAMSRWMTLAALRLGYLARISAATPETNAVAGLVPVGEPYPLGEVSAGAGAMTSTPGAVSATSGPGSEPNQRLACWSSAPTAMTPGILAGTVTPPVPSWGVFPEAATSTTSWSSAYRTASV